MRAQRECEFFDDAGAFVYCFQGLACPTGWTCSFSGRFASRLARTAPDGVSCGRYYSIAEFAGSNLSFQSRCGHLCADLGTVIPPIAGLVASPAAQAKRVTVGYARRLTVPLSGGGVHGLRKSGWTRSGSCCEGQCIDPTSDSANCGGCGFPCAVGSSCDSGSLWTHRRRCDPAAGACPSGTSCVESQGGLLKPSSCGSHDTGQSCALVDGGSAINGRCCNGACLNLGADPNNCEVLWPGVRPGRLVHRYLFSRTDLRLTFATPAQCAAGLRCASEESVASPPRVLGEDQRRRSASLAPKQSKHRLRGFDHDRRNAAMGGAPT